MSCHYLPQHGPSSLGHARAPLPPETAQQTGGPGEHAGGTWSPFRVFAFDYKNLPVVGSTNPPPVHEYVYC